MADPDLTHPSFNFYEALLNNPKENSVLFINTKGIILKVNRAFLLSFGYLENDVIGQHMAMLFSEEDRKKDKPGREINTVLDEGQCFDNNYLVSKNKSQTWVSGESILIRNERGEKCILKIIQNIHTQKESENSIIRLNNFNENILGSIEDAVIVLDADLTILKSNRSFYKLFHIPNEEVNKLDFRQLIKSFDSNASLYNIISTTLHSDISTSKIQLELNTGNDAEKKVFDISCSKLDTDDNQSNLLIIFHDITIQKQFDREREDILGFVAHELRNPLTNVTLSIELIGELLKEKNLAEFDDHLAISKKNVGRIGNLIKELYNSTKMSSGTVATDRNSFDFDQMIDESISTIKYIYPRNRIVKEGGTGQVIYGDRDKLIQVVTNYLTNAIKYSPVETDIVVQLKKEESSIIVSVTDHGIGIPPKELPYIFNRFFRAEKTKNLEGLGLGLFLCRQIINSHQGHTWAESGEGRGSTFYFSIPVGPDGIPGGSRDGKV